MTVAAAVAVVAPAGWEGRHGSYVDTDEESQCRETIAAVAAAATACHHNETSVAAAAVAAACHRREASVAAAAAAAACHRRETSVAAAAVAAAAAAAAACHRREASAAAATAAAEAYHRRETSVAVAAAAAEACHRRPRPPRPENHGRRQEHGCTGVPPTHTSPAIVSQFRGPCVESRWNGWCFLVSGRSLGGRPKSLFSRHRNVLGADGE